MLFLFDQIFFDRMKRIIILFLFWMQVTQMSAQLNINHYIRVGETRIQIGNYTGAIEYFNIVLKFKPYLPEAWYFRGVAKMQLEDYRGAINDFNKALEIKPFYPQAILTLGMTYHNLKNFEKAIEFYNKALEYDADNEGIYINRGVAHIAQKKVKEAIEDYNMALSKNPKSTIALMNRSNAKILSGDTKGAIRDLNEVLIIRPHYADAYLNRGLARLDLEDYASALRDFDQCIKLDPKQDMAFNNRGIIKQKLEDYAGALMDYDMALKLNPEMASAYFNRAITKELLKRPGYEADYKIAAQLDPRFDLDARMLDAKKLAQAQRNQANQKNLPQNTKPVNHLMPRDSVKTDNTNQQAQSNNQVVSSEDEAEIIARNRRQKLNLVVEDSRDIAKDEKKEDDGLIQNNNIAIDLQPIFVVSAFEKNAVDYDRFQYYNLAIDELNQKNNYNPILTITNKPLGQYYETFENFILYFNERIKISNNAHNLLNRGIFYNLTGKYNEAIADLDQSIKMDDKQGIAWFTRANCRYKIHEQVEALTGNSNQMIMSLKNKNNPTANASANQVQLDYSDILNDYEVALFLNSKFFFGYYNRAYIKLRIGQYKSALEDLNRAIELEPEFAEAYFNRGLTRIFLEDINGGALDLSHAGELGILGAYNIIKRYCN